MWPVDYSERNIINSIKRGQDYVGKKQILLYSLFIKQSAIGYDSDWFCGPCLYLTNQRTQAQVNWQQMQE
jgi:hypothetical protein